MSATTAGRLTDRPRRRDRDNRPFLPPPPPLFLPPLLLFLPPLLLMLLLAAGPGLGAPAAAPPPPAPVLPEPVPVPVQVEPTAAEILYGVSADDERWYHVLNQTVKLDRAARDDPSVAAMLRAVAAASAAAGQPAAAAGQPAAAAGQPDAALRVQPIVRYLVTHPGATGTQMRFGAAALGAAVACQLVSTVLLHTYFAGLYAVREEADVPAVRQAMSQIQQATAGYADKLSYFGGHAAVEYLVNVSRRMNRVFAEHDDRPAGMDKLPFLSAIKDVGRSAKALLAQRCAVPAEQQIVKTVRVTDYNDKVFTADRAEVDDHQLLGMIENLDPYDYVDFGTMGAEFWTEWLDIRKYELRDDEPLSETNE